MKAVLLGPPGVGKGTVALMLSEKYGLPKITTSDLLKAEIAAKSQLGLKAQEIMESGNLVPDSIINGIMAQRMARLDARKGFFLDGYPRTVGQAEFLDKAASPDVVLNLNADRKTIIDRLSGRRVCTSQSCGAVFNVKFNPPKKRGVCDKCGSGLMTRKDDSVEVVQNRLDVYGRQTAPLISYYRKRNLIADIDADFNIDEVINIIRQCDAALSRVKDNG